MHYIGTIVGLLAALWVYHDAKKFGHTALSATMWAVGTFMLLIVVLPLYLFLGRKQVMKKAAQDDVIDIEGQVVVNTISCPMCGRNIPEDSQRCPFCDFSIIRTCSKCGAEVGREHTICPHCSTTLDNK